MKKLLPTTLLLILATTGHAAGFNCKKASHPIEKTICTNPQLSRLDDELNLVFNALMEILQDTQPLKNQQRNWLINIRNKCNDPNCIRRVYQQRIQDLQEIVASHSFRQIHWPGGIVFGRCRMDYCWWWKVEKMNVLRAETKGVLVKAAVRKAENNYAEAMDFQYPVPPPKGMQWTELEEVFLFCSKKLPLYIGYNEEMKKYVGTLPFGEEGEPFGPTEGIANLYHYICNKGKEIKMPIKPEFLDIEIALEKPADIFDLQMDRWLSN